MERSAEHEALQMAVLQWLGSKRMLSKLAFGEAAMLRLCHELPRYTSDLNFCFFNETDYNLFYDRLSNTLIKEYDLINAQNNLDSIFLEIRGNKKFNKLTIEIQKITASSGTSEEKIAYSPHFPNQVLLRGLTLKQVLQSKVSALLSSGTIRDAFDLAFLVKKGVILDIPDAQKKRILKIVKGLKTADFDIKLRSILIPEMKNIYVEEGFSILEESLARGVRR
jgi:hypothetical protein